MKNLISLNNAKSVFFFLACILLINTFCQGQNIWKGGFPGDETNWDNPRNWSENQIPDWADLEVLIPNVESNSGYFPTIKNEVPEINYLNIQSGAQIIIQSTGVLTINGEMTYNHGIQNIGELHNHGKLIVKETALTPFTHPEKNIHNNGMVSIQLKDGSHQTLVAESFQQPQSQPSEKEFKFKMNHQFWVCQMNQGFFNDLSGALAGF